MLTLDVDIETNILNIRDVLYRNGDKEKLNSQKLSLKKIT